MKEVTCAEPRVGEGRAAVFEHLLVSLGGCGTGQGRDRGRCAREEDDQVLGGLECTRRNGARRTMR